MFHRKRFSDSDPAGPVVKPALRRVLRRLGLYDWIKEETWFYDLYRYGRDGTPLSWRRRELRFYRDLLAGQPKPTLVFDVGAHRGRTTGVFLRLGARVVAIEPDETNQRILARRYLRGYPTKPVTLVGLAASDSEAADALWTTAPGSGLNTLSEKWVRTLRENPGKIGIPSSFTERRPVRTTTLGALMERHGVPHYIKIDVEGHEVSVLRGLPRAVPLVSFEANLPEFREEAADCIALLGHLDPAGLFNLTVGDAHHGFHLGSWQAGPDIRRLLDGLGEKTVEIYWQTG